MAVSLIGVHSEDAFNSFISLENLNEVICIALNLHLYYSALIKSLKGFTSSSLSISMRHVVAATNTSDYLREVKGVISGLESIVNTKVILVALYLYRLDLISLKLIHDTMVACKIERSAYFSQGIIADKEHIKSVLRTINRFIPDKLLQIWLEANTPFFKYQKVVTPYEFLFLICNSQDRLKAIEKMPAGVVSLERHTGNGTFAIDHCTQISMVPDTWLELQADRTIDYSNVKHIQAEPKVHDKSHTHRKRSQLSSQDSLGEFRRVLRSPELYTEIKAELGRSTRQLGDARTSGKWWLETRRKWKKEQMDRPATTSPVIWRQGFDQTNVNAPLISLRTKFRSTASSISISRSKSALFSRSSWNLQDGSTEVRATPLMEKSKALKKGPVLRRLIGSVSKFPSPAKTKTDAF